MKRDNRLSRMLHVLIHMDEHDRPVTSEVISRMLDTNPVVVRRTMAGLREAGHVRSAKGHGGGWRLNRSLAEISLLDVHRALGQPPVFALGFADDHPSCLVEQAVNAQLSEALGEAETLLLAQFAATNLATIAASYEQRRAHYLGPPDLAGKAERSS